MVEYHAAIRVLLQSIINKASVSNKSGAMSPEDAMDRVLEIDARLQAAVKELEQHQKFQTRIEELQKQITEKDQIVLDLAFQLKGVEKVLEQIVDEGRAKLKSIEEADAGAVDPKDLVEYSHKICYTTGGPPGWGGDTPLVTFRPPAPQDDEMRSGLLYSK
eukprot:TRINITY_DN4124_c0_g1_i2.p1 TRINITY_DN4124_c0_g1~~TRINITY_DN4124_c0_g1_i2.p1  ORF type:complete len:172 (+),score=22.40 TRINITY_DN4124_c0_g1_i2:34-516(+)